MAGPHAGSGTEACGVAPNRATKRVIGVVKWAAKTHTGGATAAFWGALYGARQGFRWSSL
eukprot:2117330-Pyramimonas_sp.AAC.1